MTVVVRSPIKGLLIDISVLPPAIAGAGGAQKHLIQRMQRSSIYGTQNGTMFAFNVRLV
jgi:hypothetical protein